MKCYDKDGSTMTAEQWALTFENPDYKRVGFDSNDKYEVSTVWLGLDHSYGGDKILIFETMIFEGGIDRGKSIEMERYTTLQEAREGHNKHVVQWLGRSASEASTKNRFSDL